VSGNISGLRPDALSKLVLLLILASRRFWPKWPRNGRGSWKRAPRTTAATDGAFPLAVACCRRPVEGSGTELGSRRAFTADNPYSRKQKAIRLASSRVSSLRPRSAMKQSKTSIGRPFYPYYAAPLGTLDGNIQNPIAGRPTGKCAKVRHCFCRHWDTVFNLNRRFPWAAA